MLNVKLITSDIFNIDCDVLAHQVNCKGVMGAGIAKQIRDRYPIVYHSYKKYCPNSNLLGKVQIVDTDEGLIANLFAQNGFGTDKQYTDYKALHSCFIKLREYMLKHDLHSLALPYGIGCGLAGGDWYTVQQDIIDTFKDVDIVVYICKKENK